MRLTRKHFEAIARALARARQRAAQVSRDPAVPELVGVDVAAEVLADELAATNDKFDRSRFLDACHHGQLALEFPPTSS